MWLDIYNWGADLSVNGRIRGIGQNVLQPSFQTGSVISPSYVQIYFLIELLVEAFIRIKIIICVNYITIICISNNNAVINNNVWSIPRPYFSLQNYYGQA